MLFNSPQFIVFLAIVFLVYWKLRHRHQNVFLTIASYVFYGWWDWRFLSLLLVTTVIDFLVGIALASTENQKQRKTFLALSIIVNLGILGFFKYFNFFTASAKTLLTAAGIPPPSLTTLNIILPVGISFYTFQSMSYVIDVYRRDIKPTRDFIQFAAYISFFPQLVAGPIERASNLLGQFEKKRAFNYRQAVDGLKHMLWGFFKKIVVADTLGIVVDHMYANVPDVSGWELLLATFFFAFQIYGDFSGYSDIAVGTAKLFGFTLMRNFNYPYFSKNIVQFWQRWNISLSGWFRDYLFIPLGGSRVRLSLYVRNILLVFGLSGLWHGANWTFIAWGLLHGFYFVPYAFISDRNRYKATKESEPTVADFHRIALTFALVLVGWIFFRAQNMDQAAAIIQKILSRNFLPPSLLHALYPKRLAAIGLLVAAEWLQRDKPHPLQLPNIPKVVQLSIAYLLLLVILSVVLLSENFEYRPFIYFQF